jgi:cytochrome b561
MSTPKTRYSTVAILLHWAIAAALLFQIVLGSAMEGPRDATRFSIFQLHKSVGIAILLLTMVRIGWRIANPPPPLSETLKPWEQTLARSTHRAFYALLLALPLSGWLIVSTSKIGVPTRLFGVIGWPHIPVPDAFRRSVHEASELGHQVLVWGAFALVALHVAGALKHHFIDSDAELDRMIPGWSHDWLRLALRLLACLPWPVPILGQPTKPRRWRLQHRMRQNRHRRPSQLRSHNQPKTKLCLSLTLCL